MATKKQMGDRIKKALEEISEGCEMVTFYDTTDSLDNHAMTLDEFWQRLMESLWR